MKISGEVIPPSALRQEAESPPAGAETHRTDEVETFEGDVGALKILSYVGDSMKNKMGKKSDQVKDVTADIKGMGIGTGMAMGYELSGLGTYIHETAHKVMVENLYKNSGVTIQIDSFDNIRNFVKDPTPSNFGKIFTMHDINKDGAAGITRYEYGDGPTGLGEKLGSSGRQAVISAAGSVSTLIPDMIGFAAGFKLRKKHPLLGYSLMALSGVHHFANSTYPISAIFPGPKTAGHDWVSFAKATGVHPIITAAVFSLSLPTLAAGMYLLERRRDEKVRDHQALAQLIVEEKIPRGELQEIFEKYSGKEKIRSLEEQLGQIVGESEQDKPADIKKEFRAVNAKLSREYQKFSEILIDKLRDKVDEEKKLLPVNPDMSMKQLLKDTLAGIRESYREDKIGTVLSGASVAGGVAIAARTGFDVVEMIAPGSLPSILGGRVLSALIPGLGVLFTAGAAYKAAKLIKSPDVSKIDKVAATTLTLSTGFLAAGAIVPGLGIPLTIAGISGMAGTILGKWIAHKVDEK